MLDGNFQFEPVSDAQQKLLFKPGTWLNKVDFINHLVLFNNVLISVLAEKEGGKTSFVELLELQLDRQIKPICFRANTPCNPNELTQRICNELHLNMDSKTNLASVARQINERKVHVLIIIDDAHNLPEDFIKDMLTEIKSQDEFGYFHLCLVSDYSVIATLNDLAVDQFNNLIHTIELGALNETESRTYVLQRAMSKRLINKPLTDAQFKKFYQLTKGNIARINHSLEGYINTLNEKDQMDKALWIKRAGITVAASIMAGLAFMYYDPMHRIDPQSVANDRLAQATPTQQQLTPEIQPSQIASWQDASVRELLEQNIATTQPLDAIAKSEPERLALADAVMRKPLPETESVKTTIHERASHEVDRHDVKTNTVTSSNVAVEKATVQVATREIAKAQAGIYAIQLVASHNKSDVDRFRATHQLAEKTQIHRFTNNKGSWYVLTYGSFKSTSEAKQELNNLPGALTGLKPWIRDVSKLQRIG